MRKPLFGVAGLTLAGLVLVVGCERAQSAEQSQTVKMPVTKVSAQAPGGGSPSELLKGSGADASAGAEAAKAGDGKGEKNYELSVKPPAATKVGLAADVAVMLKPTNGYKVNLEYPIELKVEAPGGVKVTKLVHTKADGKVEEKQAAFQVGFTAEKAGSKAFAAELKFSVCTPKFCEIKKEKLAWSVAVD